eukprot:comp23069_c0_seq2/m.36978 comp23069_c0_seq2/g.36978  ORF comp23069_c0_seq2/g.36978 comp23069_c0_seq2/m.36978 type:complete len:137 (-) comp23069_c0_seq2:255-665(-)
MLEFGSNRIRSNRLVKLEGLEGLVNLEELYLSHNGIEVIEGLDILTKLEVLDVAANRIKTISGMAHLTSLKEFWCNHNQIADWREIDHLPKTNTIVTVYFEHNPIAQDPNYRRKLRLAIPSLTQIDATLCTTMGPA